MKTIHVDPPGYEYQTDPGDGVKNAKAIYAYSLKLSDSVGKVLDAGQFPWFSVEIAAFCLAICWPYVEEDDMAWFIWTPTRTPTFQPPTTSPQALDRTSQ